LLTDSRKAKGVIFSQSGSAFSRENRDYLGLLVANRRDLAGKSARRRQRPVDSLKKDTEGV